MKVLHLISGGDKGGAKTHVFALLSALMEDIDVMVVCFMEGVFYQEIKDMPIPSMLLKQKFRYDLSVVRKLVKHIRQQRYHLIHAHGARANFIASFLKLYVDIPIITTVHSDYRLDFTQSLYKKFLFTELNAVSLRFMDYYIAVSQNFKDMLVERSFPAERIYTVYNAIDFEQEVTFESKEVFLEKHQVPYEGKTLIGIIGRFDKVKGHDIFIKACAEVLKKNKDVLFLLAGEGDEQQNLENMCKRFNIQDNVCFLGFIDDIYSFINAIDINVLSSYSESFPYVLLEGAYMKKATISTAVGGIPDLIQHEQTGLLAKPADPKDLADQMLKMSDSEEERLRLGNALHTYAKTNFSKESLKNRHIQIYNTVLECEKDKHHLFDVMLSGYYGFDNSGDEAILDAIVSGLRQTKKDIRILVLSKQPEVTTKRYQVYSLNRYNIFKIYQYIKKCRVFINGGGSLIQDITSTNSLIYYTTLMHIAKRYGLKVMLYANGIGPITKKSNTKRAVKALKLCDYISLREPESYRELERLGVTQENIVVTADPTLKTEPAEEKQVQQIFEAEGIDPTQQYFVLSFRQWKYNDPQFLEKMVEVIDYVYGKYGLMPLFMPMQYPNDVIISNELIKRCHCPCYMLKKEYSVKELLGIIGRTAFVISMRLHTLIYAVSVNIPIIGIVYDPKTSAFMDYVQQKRYMDTSSIDVAQLEKMIDGIWDEQHQIKTEMDAVVADLKKLCDNDPQAAIDLIM